MQRPISLRIISAKQLKWNMCKGCQLFVITISDRSEDTPEHSPFDDHAGFEG
ncbi:hypothetical protein KI387_028123, partial [Taxus chinensis]